MQFQVQRPTFQSDYSKCFGMFSECSPNDEESVKLYEDPDNCAAFFECSHGVAYLFECSTGLYFNVDLQICDFATDVDCGTRPIPTPKPVTTTSGTTPGPVP